MRAFVVMAAAILALCSVTGAADPLHDVIKPLAAKLRTDLKLHLQDSVSVKLLVGPRVFGDNFPNVIAEQLATQLNELEPGLVSDSAPYAICGRFYVSKKDKPQPAGNADAAEATDFTVTIAAQLVDENGQLVAGHFATYLRAEPATVPPPKPLKIPFDADQAKASQQSWAKSLGVNVTERNSIGLELVLIPPGEYDIGSTPRDRLNANAILSKRTTVEAPFYIGRTEITQSQWTQVMSTQPWQEHSVDKGNNYPAVLLKWSDAKQFCEQLTQIERQKGTLSAKRVYRLPTEQEWEWACRAGTAGRFSCPDDEIQSAAWFEKTIPNNATIMQVQLKLANSYGLFDMHGNVSEWCSNNFEEPNAQLTATMRGGSWRSNTNRIASFARDSVQRETSNVEVGFRIVMSPVSP